MDYIIILSELEMNDEDANLPVVEILHQEPSVVKKQPDKSEEL